MSTTTMTHLLGGPKPRAMTAPNAAEDAEQKELAFPGGGSAQARSRFGSQSDSFLQN